MFCLYLRDSKGRKQPIANTVDEIEGAIGKVNWKNINIVELEHSNGDMLELSGSVKDGFCLIYKSGEASYFFDYSPETIDEGVSVLISFFYQDKKWKEILTSKTLVENKIEYKSSHGSIDLRNVRLKHFFIAFVVVAVLLLLLQVFL